MDLNWDVYFQPWPVNGGTGRECATGHQELLITGFEFYSPSFYLLFFVTWRAHDFIGQVVSSNFTCC